MEKVLTQINSQQMNTFRISSRVDCAIQINLNLDAVDKGRSCYIGNDLNPSKSFILGKFYVIRVNVNTTYSLWCKQDLRLRAVMDFNIPDICLPPVTMHSAFIPNLRE